MQNNAIALKHGVRAFEATGRAPERVRLSVDELEEQLVSEFGGRQFLTTFEQIYIRRFCESETLLRMLIADLARRGLVTEKGTVRSTYPRYNEGVATQDRIAQRLTDLLAERLGREHATRMGSTMREFFIKGRPPLEATK